MEARNDKINLPLYLPLHIFRRVHGQHDVVQADLALEESRASIKNKRPEWVKISMGN